MNHKIFIVSQAVIVFVFLVGIIILYPKASLELDGNRVNFKTINANLIIISSNPDFSNPRFLDVEKNVSFSLKPGKYYWKAGNGIIESFSKEFEIESAVGLEILDKDELKNIGNVKVNVTKNKDGTFVGHIILEHEESEKIEGGDYVGKQAD